MGWLERDNKHLNQERDDLKSQKAIDQQLISILLDKEKQVDLKEMIEKYIKDKEKQMHERIENLQKERDALNG